MALAKQAALAKRTRPDNHFHSFRRRHQEVRDRYAIAYRNGVDLTGLEPSTSSRFTLLLRWIRDGAFNDYQSSLDQRQSAAVGGTQRQTGLMTRPAPNGAYCAGSANGRVLEVD